MSTEREISGAEREALIKAFEGWTPFSDLPMSDLAWVASREFGRAAAEVQKMEYDDMSRRLSIALESEVACAEQRQRADMAEAETQGAERREAVLRSKIIRLSRDVAESPTFINSRDLSKRLLGILDA